MDFKDLSLKRILIPVFSVIFVIGIILWKFSAQESPESIKDISVKPEIQDIPSEGMLTRSPEVEASNEEDTAIREQLDRDRQEQKQTKYLKTKLEQTNLELEQEKAVAEINQIKKDNVGAFNEPAVDGQKNLPEIKVDYIGGDNVKKEAILSIAGANYQVKEKSIPTDGIQVVSISDSSVTLHFSAPQELTKTIDYKPE